MSRTESAHDARELHDALVSEWIQSYETVLFLCVIRFDDMCTFDLNLLPLAT